MNELLQYRIRSMYGAQAPLLNALLENPCQTRQYIVQSTTITAEEFAQQYPLLKQYGIACDLEVPIVRNGRLTERRVTVFRAFPEQILAMCVNAVAIPMLSETHRIILQHILVHGRVEEQALVDLVQQGKTQRELIAMTPAETQIGRLSQLQVLQKEQSYNIQCQKTILEEYLLANGFVVPQAPGLAPVKSSQGRRQKQELQLPADLDLILKGQSKEVTEKQPYLVNHVMLHRYAQMYLALQNIRFIYDETVYSVACFIAHYSNLHMLEMPPTFESATIISYITAQRTDEEIRFITCQNKTRLTQVQIQQALQKLIDIQFIQQSFANYSACQDFITQQCKLNTVQRIIQERYGKEAGRIMKLLVIKKHIQDSQIEYEAVISQKQCQAALLNLHKDGFVSIYSLGKGEWNEKSTSIYSVDEKNAIKTGRDLVARAVTNHLEMQSVIGSNLAMDEMHAKSTQVSFALGRLMELFAVLL